jgi:hypothetical protein
MTPEQEIPASSGAEDGSSEATPAVGSEAPSPETPAVPETAGRHEHRDGRNMLPGRERRRFGLERILVRLIATAGIVGIGVAIAAIMVSSKSQSWIIGLVVSGVSVVLSAILWSSRSL